MKCYDVSRLPSMIELGYDGENNWRPHMTGFSDMKDTAVVRDLGAVS